MMSDMYGIEMNVSPFQGLGCGWLFSQGVALGCHVSALRANVTGFVSALRPIHGVLFRPFGPMSGASFGSMWRGYRGIISTDVLFAKI